MNPNAPTVIPPEDKDGSGSHWEDKNSRIQSISSFLKHEVLYLAHCNRSVLDNYAEKLFDLGFESVSMLKEEIRPSDCLCFDWMTDTHKILFLDFVECLPPRDPLLDEERREVEVALASDNGLFWNQLKLERPNSKFLSMFGQCAPRAQEEEEEIKELGAERNNTADDANP